MVHAINEKKNWLISPGQLMPYAGCSNRKDTSKDTIFLKSFSRMPIDVNS
jgi:hypothetical protein